MNKVYLLAISAVVAAGYFSPASAATSMRCGVHLIQDSQMHGPGKYEVLKKCGEPADRFGNTWVYEIGGSRYVLTFKDNGELAQIKR
ncbi:MAG: hypothetical protein ABGY96_20665 [bacterium]|nr:DUF2845 domain-containing protein [Gammaproteobacteria bacterium]HIL96351.1 DUF2845 domain-containing protein [Pseudomonadales bacterium]